MEDNVFWFRIMRLVIISLALIIMSAILSYHVKGLLAMRMGFHEEPVVSNNGSYIYTK